MSVSDSADMVTKIGHSRSSVQVSSSSKPEPVVEFVPLGMIDRTSDARPALLSAPEPPVPPKCSREDRAGKVEIELPTRVRVRIDTSVTEKMLSRVLRALKGAV